jgi:hypothetical protein
MYSDPFGANSSHYGVGSAGGSIPIPSIFTTEGTGIGIGTGEATTASVPEAIQEQGPKFEMDKVPNLANLNRHRDLNKGTLVPKVGSLNLKMSSLDPNIPQPPFLPPSKENLKPQFYKAYSLLVLLVILAIRIVQQWQHKSLTYAFGFQALEAGNAFFEIGSSYPELGKYYGVVVGFLYTLPFAICGLVMGALSDKLNRKVMLGVTVILSSLTQVVMGVVDSFPVLCCMRILQGSLNSATKPLTFSLVSDYIPADRRSTANSVLSSGVYIGIALSSLSILTIQKVGWRFTFSGLGVLGTLLGVFSLFFIREPRRGKF